MRGGEWKLSARSQIQYIFHDTTLPTKICLVKSMFFSSSHVWMWELDYKENWAPKNWCFQTVVLEKALRVPWTARRSNQSILKEISPGCSLEGLMLKLKLPYFGHLMRRTEWLIGERPWCWERLKVGGERDDRGWDGWMASLTQWTWVWIGSGSWWWTGKLGVVQSMGAQRVGHDWVTELNWTEKKKIQSDVRYFLLMGIVTWQGPKASSVMLKDIPFLVLGNDYMGLFTLQKSM